jgi:hypothetical protein
MIYCLALLLVGQVQVLDYTKVDKINRFGSMVPEVCYESVVKYDDGVYRKITVVNGYVPVIASTCTSRGLCYIMDYRGQIPVGKCDLKPKVQAIPEKAPEKLEPIPDPNILRLERIKREVGEVHSQLTEQLQIKATKNEEPKKTSIDSFLKNPDSISEPRMLIVPNYKAEQ